MPLPPLGRVGLWASALDLLPVARTTELAAEAEELGFGSLWLSEGLVRDPFVQSALLLGATRRLAVGIGVAVIHGRHPRRTRGLARAVADAHPDRFALGLGVSHPLVVENVLNLRYERPLAALREYLADLDAPDPLLDLVGLPTDQPHTPRVLAALGPRALRLARDHADGAITYLVTPEHTARARELLGPDRTLVVEQAVVVDPGTERPRDHVAQYLRIEPYRVNWRRLGFGDDDVADGASDRLVHALVAVGEEEIAARVRAHFDAGADHVCLQALPADFTTPAVDQWRRLAAVV
ncbi:TIGR03620 family F420-dependent LLM class oxidoreductase [Actinosynnema sp. NPDC020468]|uniref:TIGR03620 family F420-dependent LLM class oxidoreductase n=1 Tax=Actinosynnema sp. NPDC020468 TaxID=3154488 RepID=UPI0033DD8196